VTNHRPKVVVTSLIAKDAPHQAILEAAGFDAVHRPDGVHFTDEDLLIEHIADADAIIASAEPYSARAIAAAPQLRVIARSGVGFDAIDLDACDRAGVVVTTTPGVNHHSVAEQAIALLMGVARGFPELDRQVREGRWKRQPRPRVMGCTLGIVGLGRIGRAVATRAAGLGMKVLAYEPFPNREFAEQWNVELTDWDDLLARSDYVSLHAPVTAESRSLMNAGAFAKMKPGAVLINTSRGQLVDERALCDALESGKLRGAGLDVYEVEPLPLDSPLLKFDNVLLSGHVAGIDVESQRDTFIMVAETIIALRDGQWPGECIQNLKGESGWSWDRS
jgi:D-3-phosphoglycerate dehydrogenase